MGNGPAGILDTERKFDVQASGPSRLAVLEGRLTYQAGFGNTGGQLEGEHVFAANPWGIMATTMDNQGNPITDFTNLDIEGVRLSGAMASIGRSDEFRFRSGSNPIALQLLGRAFFRLFSYDNTDAVNEQILKLDGKRALWLHRLPTFNAAGSDVPPWGRSFGMLNWRPTVFVTAGLVFDMSSTWRTVAGQAVNLTPFDVDVLSPVAGNIVITLPALENIATSEQGLNQAWPEISIKAVVNQLGIHGTVTIRANPADSDPVIDGQATIVIAAGSLACVKVRPESLQAAGAAGRWAIITGGYTPDTPANWVGADPQTTAEALNRIAAALGPI